MDSQSTQTIKLPILQPGEYDLWKMRMEQYLQCIDYTLWGIIENGNASIVTKTIDGMETVIPPTSIKEKAQRRAELKARSTLLLKTDLEVALQAPPSPDYIPGPEEPQSPPLPDFVPEPSPDYVPESDPEADPEEDDDDDLEEDPVDYPADRGDDGDEDDESSEDDDEVDIKADDDDDDEEHPAPTDSAVVALPAADQALSVEETEPFKTDKSAATPPPHPAYHVTARISIPALVPTPVWSDAEVARLLAISTPPSSPLSPWSSPLPQIPSPPLPQIPSPPLPVSSPVPVLSPSPPASPIRPLGYRAAMIRLRAEAASTSHSLPLPPPIILSHTRPAAPSSGTPPLHLLSTDRREDRPESSSAAAARPAGGLRADYGFVATMDREIRRDLERDVGYGITDSWDEIVEAMDRRAHARTARLIETEARMSREAWGRYMDSADRRRQTVITEMLAADHRRQKQLTEVLKLIKRLQTQMTEFERQQGPAKGPAQPDAPEEADSSS
ncbi:hypothetical protein Tco_1554463 [Tanacetum coccineum]